MHKHSSIFGPVSTRSSALAVALGVLLGCLFAMLPGRASAAPAGGSASGGFNTSKGATGSSKGSGYDWPELVVGGNAVSFLAPLQFGIVGYLPKARLGFQYDRQIRKGHWVN